MSPAARTAAILLLLAAPLGCVRFPEGSGPGAPAMTLAEALERRDRAVAAPKGQASARMSSG